MVDPEDYNYSVNEHRVSLDHARAGWETLAATANAYSDTTLRRDALGDDFQQLFVDVVLKHVEALLATDARLPLKPLRLLLLGTAGTGKTTTVQTTLQEIQNVLGRQGLPGNLVRVAAPTGCAAFNLRFNATTIHRLIHHFKLGSFQELSDAPLERLQTALGPRASSSSTRSAWSVASSWAAWTAG